VVAERQEGLTGGFEIARAGQRLGMTGEFWLLGFGGAFAQLTCRDLGRCEVVRDEAKT